MKEKKSVQAYIASVGVPTTLEEIKHYISTNIMHNIERIVDGTIGSWSAPKWAMPGDIVFFYHTKLSSKRINDLRHELARKIDGFEKYMYYALWNDLFALDCASDDYGGKIFAVGRVENKPYYVEKSKDDNSHWDGTVYANLKSIFVLKNPIDISKFNSFIKMNTQRTIIPVEGKAFDDLVKVISKENSVRYLANAKATPLPLRAINSSNWLKTTKEYRRKFHLEIQFRTYYVDYLLKELSDKRKIFSECNCYKRGRLSGFADNAILLDGKYIFVESKLNMASEPNLVRQLNKYTGVTEAELVKKKTRVYKEDIYQNHVLVIDLEKICLHEKGKKNPVKLAALDNINSKTDIGKLRKKILQELY